MTERRTPGAGTGRRRERARALAAGASRSRIHVVGYTEESFSPKESH